MADEREIMTWELFGAGSRDLAQAIADDGYEPDMILAIARGGLLIAGALGYALSVKNLYTMNVEFYTGVEERREVPLILPPVPDLELVQQAKVLIADDVADTGHTLKVVKELRSKTISGDVEMFEFVRLYQTACPIVLEDKAVTAPDFASTCVLREIEAIFDKLEDDIITRKGKDQHHHSATTFSRHEPIARRS